MDPVSLAAIISASIFPKAIPYLLKLGGAMGDSLTEEAKIKFGPEAWETAKRIWSEIGEKLLKKPAAREAIKDLVNTPDYMPAQSALENQIRKVLDEDPMVEADLEKIVKERIKVDLTLNDIINSTLVVVKQKGQAVDTDVEMKVGNVKDSNVTIVDIEKIE